MKASYSGTPGTDWCLAEEEYTFSGPPQECQSELTLVNNSDNKVKVRLLEAKPPSRKRKGMQVLEPLQIILSARVPPHGEVRVPATLALPANTPPGVYQAAIPFGDKQTKVTVKVHEYRELMIEPTHLRLQGNSGETVSHILVLSNLGNTPISIEDVEMVWLREESWIDRSLIYALRESGPEDTYEDFANRLLHSFRESVVAPARLQLKPASDKPLAPGQSLTRTLTMVLPKGLKKGLRYLGFIEVNEDQLWLELYCNRTDVSQTEA